MKLHRISAWRPLLRLLRWFTGAVLFILGILGLFLPVLQGILFLIMAFIFFSPDLPFANRWLRGIQQRFPRMRKSIRLSRKWMLFFGERPPKEPPAKDSNP